MHKILVAVLMALVLTLALVGTKTLATGKSTAKPKTLIAEGGMPAPPIPW